MKDGVAYYLGVYTDFADAVNRRKMAERYYFGEYSYKYFEEENVFPDK
ncbi:MAG: hypothetical protein K1W16_13870 [Lachnospiraceae bacterium]